MNIYNLRNYREIIDALINETPGIKLKLSQHIGCQPAYLSRVMSGMADFSQDQIIMVADYFQLDSEQTDYLVYVLLENRAGHHKTKKLFQAKAQAIAEKGLQLKKQLRADNKLSEEFESTYYSSWIYGALHVSLLNKNFDEKKFSEKTGVTRQEINIALNKLESFGIISKKGQAWYVNHTNTHLGSDSPWVSKHHLNWRLKICDKLSRSDLNGLHYSSVASCSLTDRVKVNEILLEAIQKCRNLIKNSSDEVSFYYGVDLFNISE